MKTVLAGALVVLILGGVLPVAAVQTEPADEALLRSLDEARFFNDTVTTLTTRVTSETPDGTRTAEITLQFGTFDGQDYARIEFDSPPELAGQIFLSTPDGTYFFGPDLDFPIKTSATTEVFGDAAVAQTSGIRFLGSYTIAARRTVTEEGGRSILELDLEALDFSVAFQAITLRVDQDSLTPLSAVLYALSGLPFYEVFYVDYATHGEDDQYVRTQRIENRLLVGRVTTSEILSLDTTPVPRATFDPQALTNVPQP